MFLFLLFFLVVAIGVFKIVKDLVSTNFAFCCFSIFNVFFWLWVYVYQGIEEPNNIFEHVAASIHDLSLTLIVVSVISGLVFGFFCWVFKVDKAYKYEE